MKVYSLMFKIRFQILSLTALVALQSAGQTVEMAYYGHWFHYSIGSPDSLEIDYIRLDTIVEMSFRKDGTYNYKGYIKTDIFTPGKGHLKFKKNFRYMDGRYEISDNTLTLLTGFSANETDLCKTYEFESGINKFKQVIPYFKLWDTQSNYEYSSTETSSDEALFTSRKRQLQTLCVDSKTNQKVDSVKFWSSSKQCAFENDWPMPRLLSEDLALKRSLLDSNNYLEEDIAKLFHFDTHNRLVKYYYTPKKDKSYFYTIAYSGDANENNTMIQSIVDSKDQSEYIFVRNEHNCLLRIEQYNAEHILLTQYYLSQ